MSTEPRLEFPQWIVWSGLPEKLQSRRNGALAWLLFRTVVEMDIATNRSRPGIVEISQTELEARAGLGARQLDAAVSLLRKEGLLRAFIPDAREEPALFQIVAPLETPTPAAKVWRERSELESVPFDSLRYALAAQEEDTATDKQKRIFDLYFDVVSMKMNGFVADELRIIAERYDLPLIERVFDRARKRPRPGIAWIMAEIRREDRLRSGSNDGEEAGVG